MQQADVDCAPLARPLWNLPALEMLMQDQNEKQSPAVG